MYDLFDAGQIINQFNKYNSHTHFKSIFFLNRDILREILM